MLGATFQGLGSCWMGAIDRKKIQQLLQIPKIYEVIHVISLGFPDEESQIELFSGDYKYWKDENGKMHVPKVSIGENIVKKF